MNRAQAIIYLATICACSARKCEPRCGPCREFRGDRELTQGRTTCVARTKIARSVRSGAYNGVRAQWDSELALTDAEREARLHARPLDRRVK